MNYQITTDLAALRKAAECKVAEAVQKLALLPSTGRSILIPVQKNLLEEIRAVYRIDITITNQYITSIYTEHGLFDSVFNKLKRLFAGTEITDHVQLRNEIQAIGKAFIEVCEACKTGKLTASDISAAKGIKIMKREYKTYLKVYNP